MFKSKTKDTFFALFVTLITVSICQAADDFPGRRLFPAVKTIELKDVYARYDKVNIVDARSKFEYDTLHVKGAKHIALSSADFAKRVAELKKETGKPIVFYCNGRTCHKSYKAVTKAHRAGITGTMAFDAGILEWTKAHPDLAVLLGRSPVDPNRLISKAEFEKHLLSPDEFVNRMGPQSIVIDARDGFQRDGVGLFVGREVRAAFDNQEAWKKHIAEAKRGKTLLIYDAVGKQVRWLQYFLEDQGVSSYYFMRHGAKGFYDKMINHL